MENKKAEILLVEDDESLGMVIKDYLNMSGYNITVCTDGLSGLNTFTKQTFDLCILDVMLPKMDGFTLATEIRKKSSSVPILFLTSKSNKEDKIAGFKTGADDFITKPFNIEELVLRIEVFLKRSKPETQVKEMNEIAMGQTVFNYTNYSLKVKNKKISLTQKEADILYYLTSNLNRVMRRDEILIKVWGRDDYFLGRSLDVYISKIRKYLSPDSKIQIENIHGIGFKLSISEQ